MYFRFFSLVNCVAPLLGQLEDLQSWTLSNAQLPFKDRNLFATYGDNSNYPECVFVFGGNYHDSLFCYNITSDTINYWGELGTIGNGVESSTPASLIITNETSNEDYLYYISNEGYIQKYLLNNDINNTAVLITSDLNTLYTIENPCMLQNPSNKDQLLIVGGDYAFSNTFIIYNIKTDATTQGRNFNTSVSRPVCVTSDSHLYVIGGRTDKIQRVSLNTNDTANAEWQTLNTTLELSGNNSCDIQDFSLIYAAGAVIFDNIVYVIGGLRPGTADYSCIVSFNINNNSVNYVGNFPIDISRYALTYV